MLNIQTYNTNMPKVSVIIPVYNVESYLSLALDCVIEQTLEDIEIICVDDGSNDSSLIILREYESKDRRIKIIEQSHQNAGVARNRGMAIATGKYLSFLDADDFFDKTMLEKAYQYAEEFLTEVTVYGGFKFRKSPNNKENFYGLMRKDMLPQDNLISEAYDYRLNFTTPCPWNKIFLRSFIEEKQLVFQNSPRANDVYFVYSALALANRIGLIREQLVGYRIGNSNSLQSNNHLTPTQFLNSFWAVRQAMEKHGCYESNKKSYKNAVLSHCFYNLNSLKDGDAFITLYSALKNIWWQKFEIIGSKEDEYYDKNLYSQYMKIMKYSPVDYLINTSKGQPDKIRYIFPFHKVPPLRNIILYGAGKIGKDYYKQIKAISYCKKLKWVDINSEHINIPEVESVKNIDWGKWDWIVIAIKDLKTAQSVISWIQSEGYGEENIIWNISTID